MYTTIVDALSVKFRDLEVGALYKYAVNSSALFVKLDADTGKRIQPEIKNTVGICGELNVYKVELLTAALPQAELCEAIYFSKLQPGSLFVFDRSVINLRTIKIKQGQDKYTTWASTLDDTDGINTYVKPLNLDIWVHPLKLHFSE